MSCRRSDDVFIALFGNTWASRCEAGLVLPRDRTACCRLCAAPHVAAPPAHSPPTRWPCQPAVSGPRRSRRPGWGCLGGSVAAVAAAPSRRFRPAADRGSPVFCVPPCHLHHRDSPVPFCPPPPTIREGAARETATRRAAHVSQRASRRSAVTHMKEATHKTARAAGEGARRGGGPSPGSARPIQTTNLSSRASRCASRCASLRRLTSPL